MFAMPKSDPSWLALTVQLSVALKCVRGFGCMLWSLPLGQNCVSASDLEYLETIDQVLDHSS